MLLQLLDFLFFQISLLEDLFGAAREESNYECDPLTQVTKSKQQAATDRFLRAGSGEPEQLSRDEAETHRAGKEME